MNEGEIMRMLMAHERELGAQAARQTATDKSVDALAQEMRDGFDKLDDALSRQIGSLRAELKTDNDREAKHRRDEIQRLEAALAERDQDQRQREDDNRRLIRNALVGLGLLMGALQTGAVVLNQSAVQAATGLATELAQ